MGIASTQMAVTAMGLDGLTKGMSRERKEKKNKDEPWSPPTFRNPGRRGRTSKTGCRGAASEVGGKSKSTVSWKPREEKVN